jgi:hypothetical protein
MIVQGFILIKMALLMLKTYPNQFYLEIAKTKGYSLELESGRFDTWKIFIK